ncbi:BafA family autotransporter [Bartonella sp. CB60]|uniref:BafA family autotransporter n=1 Tax=Bartonella sp. CB60 TaxID=3113619 RepID=UPI003FA5A5C3
MRYKFKLSFWTLMVVSFFIEIANAEGIVALKKDPLTSVEVSAQLRKKRKNPTIKNGKVEIIRQGQTSKGIFIRQYGLQSVEGGETHDVKIYSNGEQIVLGGGSYVHNTQIRGKKGMPGQQNVYDGGAAFLTDVMKGGIQSLGTWFGNESKEGGLAVDTKVSKGGIQRVLAKGEANNTVLEDGALQEVYFGGSVETLTINSNASSRVYAGAILKGAITVNDFGMLNLYASGNNEQGTTVENIILNGQNSLLQFFAAESNEYRFLIQKLNGTGRVVFAHEDSAPHYSKLYIDDLSGNIDFYLNVNFADKCSDSLFIANGKGNHKIEIVDYGNEITDSFLSSLNLVTDASGGARFTLKSHLDKKADVVDGGAYLYNLQHKKGNNEDEKIWYLAIVKKNHNSLSILPDTELSMIMPLRQEENILISQDPIINSYESSFNLYADDFSADEGKFILQNFALSDDEGVYISDNREISVAQLSINNFVENAGTIYVEAGGISKNTTIGRGGSEIVREQGTSEYTIVYEGGKQSVEGGGTVVGVQIYGGNQSVFGDDYVNGVIVGSSAYETQIYGQNETLGEQNVYDDGVVWNTKIMDGGVQTLAKWFFEGDFALKSGGLAMKTEVFAGGRQRVFAGGKAEDVILRTGAAQEVHADGYVKNLTIESGANSWVFAGSMLEGEVAVHDFGYLYLYAGEGNYQTIVESINLNEGKSRLYAVASKFDDKNSHVKKLSGVGEVIFTSDDSSLYYSRLFVDDLSGSIHFYFNVSLAEEKGDYLFIKNGRGYHAISVVDSGIEITNPSSTSLDLIVDQSGGAHFTLQDFSGEKINDIDGGTYKYGLKQKKSGYETIWYLAAVSLDKEASDNLLRGRRSLQHLSENQPVPTFSTSVSLEGHVPEGHVNKSSYQSSSRSRSRGSTLGNDNVRGHDKTSRSRPPRHLREKQPVSISSPEHQTARVSRSDNRSQPPSQKLQPVASPSLADEMIARSSVQNPLLSQVKQDEEIKVSDFLTTPSTDAVLSMAVAPALVFNNEVQTVRSGRGILDRNKKNASLWTYAIKSKEHVATGHIDFNLEQTGIVLGVNGLSELTNGEFYVGGFGGYDQARVAHARGGTSGINSYSIGAYATYFDHSGWYLDGVLKYNHYKNNLKAISTNGLSVQGDYTQWAVGTSFEAGYRFKTAQSSWMQPYAHLTWLQVEGKKIKLSHGMKGDIGRAVSLRSEVGLSLGYEFGSGTEMSSMAYITAAWLRENINNNHTTINKQHKFITDLSGNFGKLGIGLSGSVSDRLKLYAEGHYLKGRKIKQSFQGVLGIRYSF